MKICILTPRFPFPENGGDVLRINAIAHYLKEKGHKLCLCSFCEGNISDKNLVQAESLYDNIYYIKRNKLVSLFYAFISLLSGKPMQCGYYYSIRYKKLFSKVISMENPDLFISHLLRMTPYLDNEQCRKKTIIEMTDALSKTYGLSSNIGGKSLLAIIYKFEKKLIQNYEQIVIQRFKKVVLVSAADILYLGNHDNLKLHTNGIECSDIAENYNRNKICFVGNMRTIQNQDAVKSFIEKMLPKIKKQIPEVEFHIVGAQPPQSIKDYHDGKSIFVTGFIESVEDYIKDSCILVAPVNIAAGIQNKVLIGMACRIPVVLTSLISKAIPELKSGDNCFIEDNPDIFAERCVDLINDSELRNRISNAGYSVMKEFYSWKSKLEGYESI